jgi:hypothetical protein
VIVHPMPDGGERLLEHLGHEQKSGAEVEAERPECDAAAATPRHGATLEHAYVEAGGREPRGCREAPDAGADDRDGGAESFRHRSPQALRSTSATMS